MTQSYIQTLDNLQNFRERKTRWTAAIRYSKPITRYFISQYMGYLFCHLPPGKITPNLSEKWVSSILKILLGSRYNSSLIAKEKKKRKKKSLLIRSLSLHLLLFFLMYLVHFLSYNSKDILKFIKLVFDKHFSPIYLGFLK